MTDWPLKREETCSRIFVNRPRLELEGFDSGRTKGSCRLDDENRVGILTVISRQDLLYPDLRESPYAQYFAILHHNLVKKKSKLAAAMLDSCLYASALVCYSPLRVRVLFVPRSAVGRVDGCSDRGRSMTRSDCCLTNEMLAKVGRVEGLASHVCVPMDNWQSNE